MAPDKFESHEFSSMTENYPINKGNWAEDDKTVSLPNESGRNNSWPFRKENSFVPSHISHNKAPNNARNESGVTEIALPASVKTEPAVGWLVCVEGVDKGRSFRLVKGNNSIGRPGNGNTYAVSLTDQAISRKGACGVIVYNEKSNQFFITPGDLTNNINPYLNDEILLSPKLLKSRSTLEIAGDILIFVPFCSDKFKWKFEPAEQKEPSEKTGSEGNKDIVRCERGHYYHSSIHAVCPYCEELARENDPDGPTKIVF